MDLITKCHFDKNDMVKFGEISDNMKKKNGTKKDIDDLSNILMNVDSEELTCGINVMNNNSYNNFCKNDTKKKEIKDSIDNIEKIIDSYGDNGKKIYGHYINVLAEMEKDCYKTKDPVITNQLKRVAKKLSKIFSLCEECKVCDETQSNSKFSSSLLKSSTNDYTYLFIAIVVFAAIYLYMNKK
jgi:hypothetical protein